jgi:RNA polymerase sigma-70 factor (ECF subfamily)
MSPPKKLEAQSRSESPIPVAGFATTRWTLVLNSVEPGEAALAKTALDELCRLYWYPIYVFVRGRGYEHDDAEDMTQAFFVKVLEKKTLAAARRDRGKFRSFLLSALKHFMADEREKAAAIKRGGGQRILSLNMENAEGKYLLEPVERLTPERAFERKWALQLLEEVLRHLENEYAATGRGDLFQALRFCLCGERGEAPYAQLSRQLNMSDGAVKVAVHRMRKRYRERLREEIAHTVERPEDIEEELRHLFEALAQ